MIITNNTASPFYNTCFFQQVVPFSDVFRQTIIDNINEDCNNCNFTIANFANEFSTCGGGQSAIFSARIANWDSSHYPATFLLDQIQSRYTNRTSQIILSTSQFVPGSFNETELTLVVTDVQVRQTVLGSGDGTTDGIDVAVTDATTDNGSFIVFDGGEKLRATFAMTLGIGIIVSVHQAVGY